MNFRKRLSTHICTGILGLFSLICILPFLLTWVKSLNLPGLYRVFLAGNSYWMRFWKSLALCLTIAAGQTLISVLAGFALAKFTFPLKKAVLILLLVLMILPVQVSLVPGYITLRALHLLDTVWALILPAVFIPLGTFLLSRSFRAVPDSLLDAARLDGCGTWGTVFRVAVPTARSGVITVFLLSFLDAWNMVEQPIAYLTQAESYPLSVYLALNPASVTGERFALCLLAMIPPMLLFFSFAQDLSEGIAPGGLK